MRSYYRFITTSTENGLSTYDTTVFDIIIIQRPDKIHIICEVENALVHFYCIKARAQTLV